MKLAWLVFWLGLAASAADTAVADEFWKFKQIQGQPLEARVSRYDVDQQQVTLITREGVELHVSIAELDTPDKRLLARALERSLLHKSKSAPAPALPRDARPTAEVVPSPARPVVWHRNFQQAAAQARTAPAGAGNPPALEAAAAEHQNVAEHQNAMTDEAEAPRPIVWFRVLGDLRGLM